MNRQINDLTTKMQWLEKDNKDKDSEIETLKRQIQEHTAKAEALAKTVEQMQYDKEHSEWVPKKEFNELNKEYTELEEELEKREQRIKVLSDEIIQVKNQLKNMEQLAAQKPEPVKQEVSQPEPLPAEQPKETTAQIEEQPEKSTEQPQTEQKDQGQTEKEPPQEQELEKEEK